MAGIETSKLPESELLQTTDEGEVLSPLDVVGSGAPGAERILAAKEELERIEKAVADDTVVSDILGGLRAEMLAGEIREVLGPTDPAKAPPGSIRKEFGQSIMINAAHASDSAENAKREMAIVQVDENNFKPLIESFYARS